MQRNMLGTVAFQKMNGAHVVSRIARTMRRVVRHAPAALGVASALAIVACASPDAVVAPSADPHTFFKSLTVDEPAVDLALVAPYDTLQLHPHALFADDTPLPDTIVYTPSDSTVTVSPTGLVKAHFATTTPATITLTLKHEGITRSVVVQIQVRDTLPTIRPSRLTLVGTPYVPVQDSAGVTGQTQLAVTVLGPDGTPIPDPDLLFDVRSSDTTIATITNTGFVFAVAQGRVTFRMSAVAYGVRLRDSLPFAVTVKGNGTFLIGSPTSASRHTPTLRLSSDTVRIAAGGIVGWTSDATALASVVFDNPSHVDSASSFVGLFPASAGNIPAIGLGTLDPVHGDFLQILDAESKARRFPIPGLYPFTVTQGTSTTRGVVVVCQRDAVVCTP